MLKAYQDTCSLYLHSDTITSYAEAIELMKDTHCIYGKIDLSFLAKLNEYETKHTKELSKNKSKVFLRMLTLFLPIGYNKSYLAGHLKKFVCECLRGLPTYCFVKKEGKYEKLYIIVCEREFYKDRETRYIYHSHDIYRREKEGKKGLFYCSKDDDGAILFAKKGDIQKSYEVYFSYKNRLFAGNQKQFQEFIDYLKNKWMNLFKPLGLVEEHIYIKGISISRAFIKRKGKNNIYWIRNINTFNNVKCIINDGLTVLFDTLEGMRISSDEDTYKDFWKLGTRYRQKLNCRRDSFVMRCDYWEEIFDEILNDWKKDYELALKDLVEGWLF